ncbi:MAG: hypothetical protein WAX89_02790 [Alphaproteobacteria bacterium]
MENNDSRLARIEERLQYMTNQLAKLLVEADGLPTLKRDVERHHADITELRVYALHLRGMAVIVSAIVGFVASWLPELIMKKWGQ